MEIIDLVIELHSNIYVVDSNGESPPEKSVLSCYLNYFFGDFNKTHMV